MTKQTLRPAPRALALAAACAISSAGLIACGDDEEPTGSDQAAAVTADEAITEIGEVRNLLGDADTAYADGDADGADELVSDAYLEHFEIVEGPLEEADEELNEELEELIREQMREAIADGVEPKEFSALVDEADAGLDEAEAVLQEQA